MGPPTSGRVLCSPVGVFIFFSCSLEWRGWLKSQALCSLVPSPSGNQRWINHMMLCRVRGTKSERGDVPRLAVMELYSFYSSCSLHCPVSCTVLLPKKKCGQHFRREARYQENYLLSDIYIDHSGTSHYSLDFCSRKKCSCEVRSS